MYKLIAELDANNRFLMTGTLIECVIAAIRLHRRLGYNCGIYRQDGTEIRERPYQVLPEGI